MRERKFEISLWPRRQFHKISYVIFDMLYHNAEYERRDIELPASSRGNSAAVAQVIGGSHFPPAHRSLGFTEISMVASGTKPAVDHGATECDFVMKEWILSPLEKTCLRWISRGRTLAEIASLEGKSVASIENCLQNALAALQAKSIEEALQTTDLDQPD